MDFTLWNYCLSSVIPSLRFCHCGNHYPLRLCTLWPCFWFFANLTISKQHIIWLLCFSNLYKWNHIEYIAQYFVFEIHLCCSVIVLIHLFWKTVEMQLSILLLMNIWVVSNPILLQMVELWLFSYLSPDAHMKHLTKEYLPGLEHLSQKGHPSFGFTSTVKLLLRVIQIYTPASNM